MAVFSIPLRVLAVVVLSGFLCLSGTVQAQSTRTMTDAIAVDPDVEVELHAFRGRVEVTAWDRPAVRLRGEIEDAAPASDESAEIQVVRGDSTLTIKPNGETVESPGFFTVLDIMTWGREEPDGPKTAYSVRVPTDASVTLKLDAADAAVNGVGGDVTIEGISSSVDVREVEGRVLAGTVSGTLHAEDVRGKLGLATFSGDLRTRLSALVNDVHVGTFWGDVEVRLPTSAAFDFETDITWADVVTSNIAMPDSATHDDGPVSIHGGGPTVLFESFGGSLTLQGE